MTDSDYEGCGAGKDFNLEWKTELATLFVLNYFLNSLFQDVLTQEDEE